MFIVLHIFLQVEGGSSYPPNVGRQARCVGAFGCLDLIDPKTGEPLGFWDVET